MKTQVFSILDHKSSAYGSPFFSPAVGVAIRSFSDLCRDDKTNLFRHPEDFSLFHIGEFDDSNATLVSFVELRPVAKALDFVKDSSFVA